MAGNKNSGKRKGDTKIQRIENEHRAYQYIMRGLTQAEVAAQLHVGERTVRKYYRRTLEALLERAAAQDLYSLRKAFAELNELWREGWVMMHRSAQPMIMFQEGEPQQIILAGLDGKPQPLFMDDRAAKALVLRALISVVERRSKLAGFASRSFLERITMVETAQGKGIRIERLTFEEQLGREVEELQANEGLRRSEGILTD